MNKKSKATAEREAPFRGGEAARHTSNAPGRRDRPICARCKKNPRMELRPWCKSCDAKDNRIFRECQRELLKSPILELPAGVSPWKKIEVLESDWQALVRFFMAQVEVFKTSYNTPGKDDWEAYFAENHPEEYKIYYAAKLAATRKA